MIKLEQLSRKYGDFTAVDEVSFEIYPGEIVGLLGHNGAGKTTIMKMMTGFLEPTSGTITIDGQDITNYRRNIQKKIGYLPENCPVYPEMTTLGYLDYSAALHGVPKRERPPLIMEALSRTALTEKARERIATLSRGYRQRTGVAQAILHKPSILIMDEPTNGLDPTQIQHMRNLISELSQTATLIVSTHILQEVQAICDRVIIIKDGRVALDSRLDELQQNNRLLVTINEEGNKAGELFTNFSGVNVAARMNGGGNDTVVCTYELQLEKEANKNQTAASIATAIHEQGWNLYSMHFEARNLEKVFTEITSAA
ncbi:MAG: ABC transporter ATP-binding protein [Desulforhopalus sp.]